MHFRSFRHFRFDGFFCGPKELQLKHQQQQLQQKQFQAAQLLFAPWPPAAPLNERFVEGNLLEKLEEFCYEWLVGDWNHGML